MIVNMAKCRNAFEIYPSQLLDIRINRAANVQHLVAVGNKFDSPQYTTVQKALRQLISTRGKK